MGFQTEFGEWAISKSEDVRKKARELLLKAKVYRFFAAAFAMAGVAVFLILYFKHVEGRLLEALTEPATIGIVLVPFLPAVILSWKASKIESKLLETMNQGREDSGKKA